MGVTLPSHLDEALDLIGVNWPNVDEDDYREMAQAMREFADDIDDGAGKAHAAISDLIAANEGLAVQALERHWCKVKDTYLANLAEAGRLAATALDGVAVLIEGAKLAAIAQLGILAAEIAAAVAASPVTLGLSTLGGLAATQATSTRRPRLPPMPQTSPGPHRRAVARPAAARIVGAEEDNNGPADEQYEQQPDEQWLAQPRRRMDHEATPSSAGRFK